MIFLSIITFYINHKLKEYLIIILISTIIALYSFEAYLISKLQISNKNISSKNQIKEQILKDQLYENKTGKKFDKRTKSEIFKDQRKINNKIQVVVSPNNYINKDKALFPFSGISNSKNNFL